MKQIVVMPTKSICFTNRSSDRFYIEVPGAHSLASYYSSDNNYACERTTTSQREYIGTGLRVVLTNDSPSFSLVYGAYEVFKPVIHSKTATTSINLSPNDELTFFNISTSSYNVYFNGKCEYKLYNLDGSLYRAGLKDSYYLYIPSAKRVEFKNTDTIAYDIFGAYETFFIAIPISGLDATQSIAKIDPSKISHWSFEADPIDCSTGAQIIGRTLLTVNGAYPIQFKVQYNSLLLNEGVLGKGWSHNFETRLEKLENGDLNLHWNANRVNNFVYVGPEQLVLDFVYDNLEEKVPDYIFSEEEVQGYVYEEAEETVFENVYVNDLFVSGETATQFDRLTRKPDGTYTLIKKDKTIYHFNASGQLTKQENGHGQFLSMDYDEVGRLAKVNEPFSGRYISLHYNANGFLDYIFDPLNRNLEFIYKADAPNLIEQIVDAKEQATMYTYYPNGQIESATDHEGIRNFYNTYDEKGRIQTQDDARSDNAINRFYYDETSQPGKVLTTVYNREGYSRVLTHDTNYRLLSIQDELGKTVIKNEYYYNGNLKKAEDVYGKSVTYEYDERSNLVTTRDYLDRTTQMTYYPNDNLKSVTNPVYAKVYYYYNNNNNVTRIVDSMGNEMQYEYYTDTGLLRKEVTPRGGLKEYNYTDGQVRSVTDAVYNTVYYGYDGVGRLKTVTDAEDNTTTMHYDKVDNLEGVEDPLGRTKQFTYDSHGNKLTEQDHKSNLTKYTYTPNGKLETVEDAYNNVTQYRYDGEDRLEYLTDARNNTTQYIYDAKGRLVQTKDPLGNVTETDYDDLDRVTGKTDALLNKVLTIQYDDYNSQQSITDALNRTTVKHFDDANRLDWVKDPMDRYTHLDYDALNRVSTVTDPMSSISSQDFDEDGNLAYLIDPNSYQQELNYDLAGRLRSETFAGDYTKTFDYNNRNLLKEIINARNQTATIDYYPDRRLKNLEDPSGKVTYHYDDNGNLTDVVDENTGETINRHYDNLNRVDSYTDARGNTIGYYYDAVGNLEVLIYPDGKQVAYGYDENNRLKTVTDWAYRVTEYQYYPNGLLWKTKRPNGTELTYEYDIAGQLTKKIDVDTAGNIISQFDFTYYDDGTVETEQGSAEEQIIDVPNTVMTYTYDNRLATYNGQAVVYDEDGNMTYGPLNGGMTDYSFDARNRLTNVGNVIYQYDSENNRIGVMESVYGSVYQSSFVVNPQAALSQVLVKTDSEGKRIFYIYGIGLLAQEDEQGNYRTYHYDRRGSTIAITDENGSVTDEFQYDPYGQLAYHSGETATLFLYNGKHGVMTDSNGLLHMRSRYYNPEVKRFINRDVVQGSISEGQSLNKYAYVNGNPVSYIDPFGMSRDGDGQTVWGLIGDLYNLWKTRYQETFIEAGVDPFVSGMAFDLMFGYATGEIAAGTVGTAGKMWQGAGAAKNGTRVFASNDPLVADIANAIEARFPNKVVDVNKIVKDPSGRILTDYDIELDKMIIQVKSGGGKGLTTQLKNTAASTDKSVIAYGPDIKSSVVKSVQNEGFQIFNNIDDLINYVGHGV